MGFLGDAGLVLISLKKEEKRIKKGAEKNAALSATTKNKVNTLNKLASEGNTTAAYQLGNMYITGEEVGYNPELAVKYFKKAANKGDFDACYALALYYKGYWSNCHRYDYDSYQYYLAASRCKCNDQKYMTEVQRALRNDFGFNKNEFDKKGNPLVWFKADLPIK